MRHISGITYYTCVTNLQSSDYSSQIQPRSQGLSLSQMISYHCIVVSGRIMFGKSASIAGSVCEA